MANLPNNDNEKKPIVNQELDQTRKGINLFFGEAERKLFDNLGKELVNGILKESFILFKVDYKKTQTHSLYGESKNKVWLPTVEVFGRINVEVDKPDYMSAGGIIKKGYGNFTADIYRSHLEELGVNIMMGDFVYCKGHYYEITDDGSSNISNEYSYAGDIVYSIKITGVRVKKEMFEAR